MSYMALPLQLPYYAPHTPSPLPTREEIRAAPLLRDYGPANVAIVGDHFFVKYGVQVNPLEGENMLFVKETTRVPVPQVYAIYADAEDACNYIIMENLPVVTLASAWPSLEDTQKDIITEKLKSYFNELRSLPPPGYFGSIGKRPLLESMFWTPEGVRSISGPFDTEDELNEATAQKYTHFGASVFKADFYRRACPRVLTGHSTTFTHADLQRKNILIEMASDDDDIRVALVDWGKSGWLPSYWEYSMAMISHPFRDDWYEWLGKILEPFYVEYPYLNMLFLELWS